METCLATIKMKSKFIAIFMILGLQSYGQEYQPLNIYQESTGDGGFQYFAQNIDIAPYQLEIDFVELQNLKSNVPLPYYTVVYPGKPQPLFLLEPKSNGSTSFRSSYKLTLGDPTVILDADFAYTLPYEDGQQYTLVQGANGSYTHQGKYAWDFAMEEGTKVCASRAGVVVKVKEDSNIGGADISFMEHANRITVLHSDGSYADYVHLKQNGALVNSGDEIVEGQVVGYSGNTGWSTKPHLHFQVYRAVQFGIETVPVKFMLPTGVVDKLTEQQQYRAIHPK